MAKGMPFRHSGRFRVSLPVIPWRFFCGRRLFVDSPLPKVAEASIFGLVSVAVLAVYMCNASAAQVRARAYDSLKSLDKTD